MGGLRLQASTAVSSSVAALQASLTAVHGRQFDFLATNQRFATWTELVQAGTSLPSSQEVLHFNVTPSHWYLSIRDRESGAICDHTGELFDDAPGERAPRCRSHQG
jgi:hypothetical protein